MTGVTKEREALAEGSEDMISVTDDGMVDGRKASLPISGGREQL